jgi:transcriptional regulator with XRE-family HTH domain
LGVAAAAAEAVRRGPGKVSGDGRKEADLRLEYRLTYALLPPSITAMLTVSPSARATLPALRSGAREGGETRRAHGRGEENDVVRTSVLTGLGPALRWMRERRGRKQYQVAAAAGITKGMLSAYETGRQRPSLETLDKILDTLESDLNDLHNALQIVNGRPAAMVRAAARPAWDTYPLAAVPASEVAEGHALDVYGTLGIAGPLPPEEERALTEMLDGFHRLVRYLHGGLAQPAGRTPATPEAGRDGGEGD